MSAGISPHWVMTMARYNHWQNTSLYTAADGLSETDRQQDRGAFYGSLHGTLAHILWADQVWMNRFNGTPAQPPAADKGQGPNYADWDMLKADRIAFDRTILDWASQISADWLASDFTWSNLAGTRTTAQPAWRLVTHFFNHQTHHRGQAHALLTAAGAMPEDTDLFLMTDTEPAHE